MSDNKQTTTLQDAAKMVGLIKEEAKPFSIRVSGRSDVHKVATSIFYQLKAHDEVIIRTLGGGPTQQACKAIAIARGRSVVEGLDIICRMGLVDEPQEDGKELTIMTMSLTRVRLQKPISALPVQTKNPMADR